jgi:pre-mRNA-splicing factor RBM22/SLT11
MTWLNVLKSSLQIQRHLTSNPNHTQTDTQTISQVTMPPQIKHDLNRSGWESTDFPSVCESCLPDNPFVQMLKEDFGDECKLCSRPFTVFRWKADRTSRQKRTKVCLTCARLKNCCQSCVLDLSFGLSIPVRDAALKMIAPGPTSDVNKQFYAQEHEKALEEGRGDVQEAYSKTQEKAGELLRRLARSEPYRRRDGESSSSGMKALPAPGGGSGGPGPIRSKDSRAPAGARARSALVAAPITPQDILPPKDPNIASLFITGVEDDLPEHAIRKFFTAFGTLRSVVVSHRAHCGYVNFQTRDGAEAAAEACQGKAIIAGCPIRVRWGKPKKLDSMEEQERMHNLVEGRATHAMTKGQRKALGNATMAGGARETKQVDLDTLVPQAPPGVEEGEEANYASLQGD